MDGARLGGERVSARSWLGGVRMSRAVGIIPATPRETIEQKRIKLLALLAGNL